jgi:hypothetical protein
MKDRVLIKERIVANGQQGSDPDELLEAVKLAAIFLR